MIHSISVPRYGEADLTVDVLGVLTRREVDEVTKGWIEVMPQTNSLGLLKERIDRVRAER